MLDQLSEKYDRILVIGYSMGTVLEIEALPDYPKVRGMLLLNVPMCPFVNPRIIPGTLKMMDGKKVADSSMEESINRSMSIALTPGLFKYIRWIPRFIELFGLCRHCRRHKDNIQVPCFAYLGSNDELVSMRSRKYLEGNPHVTLRIMEGGGHLYYPPEYIAQMRTDLHTLMEQV